MLRKLLKYDLRAMFKYWFISALASIEPYLLVLVFFLLFNGIVEQGAKWIERKMNYYR